MADNWVDSENIHKCHTHSAFRQAVEAILARVADDFEAPHRLQPVAVTTFGWPQIFFGRSAIKVIPSCPSMFVERIAGAVLVLPIFKVQRVHEVKVLVTGHRVSHEDQCGVAWEAMAMAHAATR